MKIHEQNKTPSFPFYAKDWLTDIPTKMLSHEEKGIYMDMLAYSWLDDLPSDQDKLQNLLGCRNAIALRLVCESHWYSKDGFLYNKKLEKIKEELTLFREKKSLAGQKGNEKRWKDKQKAKVSHSDKFANRKVIAKSSPPIPSPIPNLNNISKDICDTQLEEKVVETSISLDSSTEPKTYGNKQVTDMLEAIKAILKIKDFEESQRSQRNQASNLVKLMNKIGEEVFKERFVKLFNDDFHRQKMGSLNYIYRKIKGFVDQPSDSSIKPGIKTFNTKNS